jgi:hypothetical protein
MPPLYKFETLSFDSNPIVSFTGFSQHPTLKNLYLNNTKLVSFSDAPDLPVLELISLRDTPLAYYSTLPIMVLILYPTVTFVNGEGVRPEDQRSADRLREQVAPFLLQGWILSAPNPIRLMHAATRSRLSLNPNPSPPPPAKPQEEILEEEDVSEPVEDDHIKKSVKELNAKLDRDAQARVRRYPPPWALKPTQSQSSSSQDRKSVKRSSMRQTLRTKGGPSDYRTSPVKRDNFNDTESESESVNRNSRDSADRDSINSEDV